MAASSSGEGFWFSDSGRRSRDYHDHHHLRHDDEAGMRSLMMMEDERCGGYQEDGDENFFPYAYGDPNGVNWEERCLELEMSLQRFRDQAGKIRGLLREKVSSCAIYRWSLKPGCGYHPEFRRRDFLPPL